MMRYTPVLAVHDTKGNVGLVCTSARQFDFKTFTPMLPYIDFRVFQGKAKKVSPMPKHLIHLGT